MITFSLRRLLLVLPLLLVMGGCGRRARPAPIGPDVLFQRAMTAYQAGDHSRAIRDLDVFLQSHPGDPRAPRARLTLGRARMAKRDYLLAAGDFSRLLNDFPQDTLGRDARLGLCEAYRSLSPAPARDQQYTIAAIAYCESFAGTYPGTPDAARAAEWVRELRTKLAQKAYDTGLFYFRRGAYDAGVVYFQETVDQYGDTPMVPAALLRLVESYERIGYKEEAEEARARLLRDFPQSAEARSLQTGGTERPTG